MLVGFNTNVRYDGRLFHVQTEDEGQGNPQITSLVFEGGAILASRRQSYKHVLDSADLESSLRDLMEEQHNSVVQALKCGDLDDKVCRASGSTSDANAARPSAPSREFGEGVITDAPLGDVIVAFLAST